MGKEITVNNLTYKGEEPKYNWLTPSRDIPDIELTPKERRAFRNMRIGGSFLFGIICFFFIMLAVVGGWMAADSASNHQLYGDMYCKQMFGANWKYNYTTSVYSNFDTCFNGNQMVPIKSTGFGHDWTFEIINLTSYQIISPKIGSR